MIGLGIEKAGIPVAHITPISEVAEITGSLRILHGTAIPYVTGDINMTPDEEKVLNKKYFDKALEMLQTDVEEQTLFSLK